MYCEKVMASNEQEALSMIECAKNHVVLLEAIRPDFDPAFDMIKTRFPALEKFEEHLLNFASIQAAMIVSKTEL